MIILFYAKQTIITVSKQNKQFQVTIIEFKNLKDIYFGNSSLKPSLKHFHLFLYKSKNMHIKILIHLGIDCFENIL